MFHTTRRVYGPPVLFSAVLLQMLVMLTTFSPSGAGSAFAKIKVSCCVSQCHTSTTLEQTAGCVLAVLHLPSERPVHTCALHVDM